MEILAKVVELGGFSAAARAFRMTPSAVSKLVARLEARGIVFRRAEVPGTSLVQLFLFDPAGNGVELQFADNDT